MNDRPSYVEAIYIYLFVTQHQQLNHHVELHKI